MQNETMFESPSMHEASMLGNPEFGQQEFEYEFEGESSHLGNPEFELEFEGETGGYGEQPGYQEFEFEGDPFGSQPEADPFGYQETTFETGLNGYTPQGEYQPEYQPETDQEAETDRLLESLLGMSNPETYGGMGEADPFFGKIWRGIKKVGRIVAPLARKMLPGVIRALSSVVPIPGAAIVGNLVASRLREAEAEVAQLEQQVVNYFAQNEVMQESGSPQAEAIHEIALAELLAAQAAQAQTETDAEASIAAALPLLTRSLGATRLVRPVTPTLVQARARLVRTMRQQNPQLLRLVPSIDRLAIGLMRQVARQGRPVNNPVAITAYKTAARRVMGSPRVARRAVVRNMGLQVRTSPSGWRITVYQPRPIVRVRRYRY